MSGYAMLPAGWLQSGPNGITDASFRAEILASFASPPVVTRLRGPETLIRAVGRNDAGRLANPYRGYWVRESSLARIYGRLGQFEGWLSQQELSSMAEWRYRAFTAVCLNWNDFAVFAELRLPADDSIQCLVGPVAPQPLKSSLSMGAATTPVLRGGAEQIFFRGGDTNPLYVRFREKPDLF